MKEVLHIMLKIFKEVFCKTFTCHRDLTPPYFGTPGFTHVMGVIPPRLISCMLELIISAPAPFAVASFAKDESLSLIKDDVRFTN